MRPWPFRRRRRFPDRIQLRGLRAMGTHGVLPEEQQRAQPFEVDLDLEVDLSSRRSIRLAWVTRSTMAP